MNLADKTFLNVLSKSSEAFLLLLSSAIMVRYLSKTEYGTLLQVMLIANTVILFTLMGLPQSIYYFYHKVIQREHLIIQTVLLSSLVGLIASAVVYSIRYKFVDWLNNPQLGEYGWVAPLLIFLRAPAALREPILLSNDSLILNSIVTFLSNVIIYVSLILGTVFTASVELLLKIMIVTYGVQFGTFFLIIFWVVKQGRVQNLNELEVVPSKEGTGKISLKDQLKYAFPIGISSYVGVIGQQIDQYIVSVFFTPTNYAVYSRGAMRIPVLSEIAFTVNDIMMPKYVNTYKSGDIEAFLGYYHQCIEKVAKINFPIFSFLLAAAPSLVTFVYTENYIEASNIFRVYLFLLVIGITAYGIIPRASGRTSYILHSTLIFVLGNVIMSLLLISPFGPIGAAIATIVSGTISVFYLLIASCKILNVSFSNIFPWRYLYSLFSTSLIASIPVYCIDYLFSVKGMWIIPVLLLEAMLYFYCVTFILMRKELIYSDDFEFLSKWLRFDVKWWMRKLLFL